MYLCEIMTEAKIDNRPAHQGDLWVIDNNSLARAVHQFAKPMDRFGDDYGKTIRHGWSGLPKPCETLRLAIYNGVGTGYGDMICGSTAIRLFHERIRRALWEPQIDLVVSITSVERYLEVFARDPHIHAVIGGGLPFHELQKYNLIASTESLVDDPDFETQDMVSYFCQRLGAEDFADYDLRPRIYPDLLQSGAAAHEIAEHAAGRKALILNFHASGHRKFPQHLWTPLAKAFAEDGWCVLCPCGPAEMKAHNSWWQWYGREFGVINLGAEKVPFWRQAGWIGAADALVTPDTSLIHVAGALGTPCVGVFYSIEPELRIKHYPTVRGYCPSEFRRGAFWGMSKPAWTEDLNGTLCVQTGGQGIEDPASGSVHVNQFDLDHNPAWLKPWSAFSIRKVQQLVREVMHAGRK